MRLRSWLCLGVVAMWLGCGDPPVPPLGPVGHAAQAPGSGLVALYRCRTGTGDHFVTSDAACEGQISEGLLGYVWPSP